MTPTRGQPPAAALGPRHSAAMDASTIERSHEITSHDDAALLLRSRDFTMPVAPALESGYGASMLAHTLAELDGEDHRDRRRALGKLFRPDVSWHHEEARLRPAIDALMSRLAGQRAPQGDLRELAREMLVSVMAGIVGLDGVYPDRVADVMSLFGALDDGARVKWSKRDPEEVMRASVHARERIIETYFRPSWRRRAQLVERAERGELDPSELPRDLITTMIRHRHHYAHWDDALVERETLLFVVGSIGTTSNTISWATWELEHWLTRHPEDGDLRTDSRFLRDAVNESLRLHPENPFIPRRATRDFVLPSGLRVAAGDLVKVVPAANLDGAGEASTDFDPHRGIPLERFPFGFSFGGGRHTCIGKGLVLGDQSEGEITRQGTIRAVLLAFYGAGMRLDPARPPSLDGDTVRRVWKTMPVIFAGL